MSTGSRFTKDRDFVCQKLSLPFSLVQYLVVAPLYPSRLILIVYKTAKKGVLRIDSIQRELRRCSSDHSLINSLESMLSYIWFWPCMAGSGNSWDPYKSLHEKHWRHSWATSPTAHNDFIALLEQPPWNLLSWSPSLLLDPSQRRQSALFVAELSFMRELPALSLPGKRKEVTLFSASKYSNLSYRSENDANSTFTPATIRLLFLASTLTATMLWEKGNRCKGI